MNEKPIPHGYHAATPYLIVKDAPKAIEFYKAAFGATELFRLVDLDGRLVHADIKIGDSPIMVVEEIAAWGNFSPHSPEGGTSCRVHLLVEDVDAVANRALAAGAKILIPIADQFYGQRGGRLEDPFGHVWAIATHQEDLTPEEMQSRFEAFLKRIPSSK
jgi:PhnB protein